MQDMDRSPGLAFAVLVASATLALASCSGPPTRLRADALPSQDPPPSAQEVARQIEKVFALHNELRSKDKLNSLEISPKLTKAAQRHADDMAKRQKMGHTGSDGTAPADRIVEAGYKYRRCGENVAYGRWEPDRLMKGWMDSPPHRKNILGSYSQIGVACATAEDGKTYWCVTFGLPIRP
jgi:uncharacterized protein YkwD